MIHYRYGNIKQAVRLEQILEELKQVDPGTASSYRSKVHTIIEDCNVVLHEFGRIRDKRIFEMIWKSWYVEMMRRVGDCVLSEIVRTHLRGVIQALLNDKRRYYLIFHRDVGKKKRARLVRVVQKHADEFREFKIREGI